VLELLVCAYDYDKFIALLRIKARTALKEEEEALAKGKSKQGEGKEEEEEMKGEGKEGEIGRGAKRWDNNAINSGSNRTLLWLHSRRADFHYNAIFLTHHANYFAIRFAHRRLWHRRWERGRWPRKHVPRRWRRLNNVSDNVAHTVLPKCDPFFTRLFNKISSLRLLRSSPLTSSPLPALVSSCWSLRSSHSSPLFPLTPPCKIKTPNPYIFTPQIYTLWFTYPRVKGSHPREEAY